MDIILANKIIDFIFTATGRHSIVCGVDGVIVAAKVSSRIGDVHTAARKMLRENLPHAMISEAEEQACGGEMKAGCNLPIWHNGELIGSIGITGDPDRTEPLTRLASGLISKELREQEMLAERTRLLEQLHQSQKMESLGILSAGVAHNINNVLAVIMGTASLREQLAEEPADREAYRVIDKVCRRGREVVKSLIQFGKPTISSRIPIELHALIREVLVLLQTSTQQRVRIVAGFAGESLWIRGDPGEINSVLMNLCLNAIDAMADGGTLTLRTIAPGPEWVEVSVEDDGEGMSPGVLAHVLEPFFTTREVGKGTGLGLSMAYGVVKAHGGTLAISSQEGQGTTVNLRFPRLQAPERDGPEPSAPPAGPIRPMTVFLVDDEEDVRILMQRMLRNSGLVQVEAFAAGEAVLERLHSGARPDLVILDQNMPGLTGVQTMERIRALDPGLPILISSGQPEIEDWDCFKLPGLGVISKPFSMQEIAAKLASMNLQSDGGNLGPSITPTH